MAVYTEVTDEELVAFIAGYDIGDVLSCKGIAEGVENSNFLLSTSTGPYILTLYEKRVETTDLPFFLGLMEHLASAGIPCPQPVCGQDGQSLKELSGRPAAIVSFLDGMWPRRITFAHCAELGRRLAELHLAGSDFRMVRQNALSVAAWRPLLERSQGRADEVSVGLADLLAGELDGIEKDWPTDLPAGIIHADLFPDNVFFRDGRLSGIIDFYFACTDAYVYDIAICLNAWCFEVDGGFNITNAHQLLHNYRKVRPLSGREMVALPLLAKGAAMRFLLTRLYDWLNTPADALVVRKDPMEYWHKLTFHKGTDGPQDYGLEL